VGPDEHFEISIDVHTSEVEDVREVLHAEKIFAEFGMRRTG
jgi:hypothetical protein